MTTEWRQLFNELEINSVLGTLMSKQHFLSILPHFWISWHFPLHAGHSGLHLHDTDRWLSIFSYWKKTRIAIKDEKMVIRRTSRQRISTLKLVLLIKGVSVRFCMSRTKCKHECYAKRTIKSHLNDYRCVGWISNQSYSWQTIAVTKHSGPIHSALILLTPQCPVLYGNFH